MALSASVLLKQPCLRLPLRPPLPASHPHGKHSIQTDKTVRRSDRQTHTRSRRLSTPKTDARRCLSHVAADQIA